MMKSLDESIVIQAIKDLLSKSPAERADALQFFVVNGHEQLCEAAGLDAKVIRLRVIEAVKQSGIRREKLIKDLARDLPRI